MADQNHHGARPHRHHHHLHHHHPHPHGHHRPAPQGSGRRLLTQVLLLTSTFFLVELIGGYLTGSLALISDAFHMLSDVAALALSLIASWLATRPASLERTYGLRRGEVLAALANAVTLVVIAVLVVVEALERLAAPPAVNTGLMMAIAAAGLAINLISAAILHRGNPGENLNLRGAFLHVLADALGSVGALGAGAAMALWGWYVADPLISMLIALLIGGSGLRLLWETLHVLMEGTPRHIDAGAVQRALCSLPGVCGVHDLHIWTVTSGMVAMTAHVEVQPGEPVEPVLARALAVVQEEFAIQHPTIQIEPVAACRQNCQIEPLADRP